jgi:glycosyltransferase involved in cell wall biosynthesis
LVQAKRAKVAVVHPRLGSGGSEARALWALQALRADFDLSLITCGPVDLDRLNVYYGTSLVPADFRVMRVPLPPGVTANRFNALQGHILQRYCQRVARQFDAIIATYNPLSFGVPAIQCIADFSFVPEWILALHPTLQTRRGWWYGDSILRRTYLGLCNLVSRSDPEGFKTDLMVANSEWSRELMREKFGVESRLLYPPVAADFPAVPFAERDAGFVCIGRAVPEKRPDGIIRILERVRQRGHDIHFHILGGVDDSPYGRQLKQLAQVNQSWVYPEGVTFGDKKKELLVRHRFGINACLNEAFGIAVAEMVKAGCITFVPKGGGQGEIVNHPGLIFENDDDAVNKIDAVLRDPAGQETLAANLRAGAERFSTRAFSEGLLALTREFLEGRRAGKSTVAFGATP